MSNIFRLPSNNNPFHQRAAYQRLIAPLDARIARDAFAVKQLAFFDNPTDETEREMLRARDEYSRAHQAAYGSGTDLTPSAPTLLHGNGGHRG